MAKKKKTGANRQSQPQEIDPRTFDQTMASLGALLDGREFESIEEANAFIQQLLEKSGPLPSPPAETPLEKAQAVMYDAFEARSRKQRIELAKKALSISRDCADAYVLLAQEEARSLQRANAYYAEGMQAGRRALGEEAFHENAGHFWLMLDTRPFMRAMEGYAMTLWKLGEHEASVDHQQEMLRLNPRDNQGIRYSLIHGLLALRRLADAERLFQDYNEESTAFFTYPRALATYLTAGPTASANLQLKQAIGVNTHVPVYLLAEKRMPRRLPDYYGFGDENEAVIYVSDFGSHWHEASGALEWLRDIRDQVLIQSPGLQEEFFHLSDTEQTSDSWDYIDEFDGYPPFELDEFLAEGGFPKSEHGSIRRCLSVGLGNYLREYYGEGVYGKQPAYLIDEVMHLPYAFGYGALEVIRHKRLRPATKLTVCAYALRAMRFEVELGIPYGILALLGYMATQDALEYVFLKQVAIALGYGAGPGTARSDWLEGTNNDEMLPLVDWIATNDEIPADEKLWWAWKLAVQSHGRPPVGKAMANHWLSLDALTTDAKLTLCRSWLTHEDEAGTPPPMWQLYQALLMGQGQEAERLIEEYDLEAGPEFYQMLAEKTAARAKIKPGSIEEMFFTVRTWVMVPAFLHRLAIPGLVRFGADLEETIETYWEGGTKYREDANTAGVADAIREFSSQLSAERLRELIERGINHGSAVTRKTFYLLSEEFYGDEYLARALQDNASSMRKWAAKKLARRH